MAIAGGIPWIESTCGLSIRSKNCRAYGENVSIYRRCPSAYKVSNASELFPDPLNPVITINWFVGRSRSKFLRLLWRTPRNRITPFGAGADIRTCNVDAPTRFSKLLADPIAEPIVNVIGRTEPP